MSSTTARTSSESYGDRVLAIAADHRFAPGLIAATASALSRLPAGSQIDLLVFDEGLTAEDRRMVEQVVRRSGTRTTVHIAAGFTSLDRKVPIFGHIPNAATYSRLLIPGIAESSRLALYLDADVLVRDDLDQLLSVPLDDAYIAACVDLAAPTVEYPLDYSYAVLGRQADEPYFNAGVLLIDVPRWRRDDIAERVLQYLDRWHDDVHWHDQDGINAICGATARMLDPRWNYQERVEAIRAGGRRLTLGRAAEGFERAGIVHFNDAKPWQSLGWLFPNPVSRRAHARWWRFALTSPALPWRFRAAMLVRFLVLPPFLVARKLWRISPSQRGS
jgi:lipopolysaccharide biosynthesis glycosyltransferase